MPRYGLYLADLRRARTDSQGTINYAIGLARALVPLLGGDEELVVLANRPLLADLAGAVPAPATVVIPEPKRAASRLYSDHVRAPRSARQHRLEVLHFPKGHVPWWRPPGTTYVATLHDDIAVRYARGQLGQARRGLKGRYFEQAVLHAVGTTGHVLTVSRFSEARLRELAAERGRRDLPVTVTGQGVSLPPVPYVPVAQRRPQLVHIGSALPHKQTALAIGWSLRYLAERGWPARLVVTGAAPPAAVPSPAAGHLERVTQVLTNAEMAHLLAESEALVFTSNYEGFGLPPVEATSLGTPAVWPATGAMAEVLEGCPGGFDPGDYHSFARALDTVRAMTDADRRAAQEAMRARHTWEAAATRTLAVYRSLAPGPPRPGHG